MGYSLAWVALRETDPRTVFDALHVEPVGEPTESPDSPLSAITTPSGWLVLVANLSAGGDDRVVDDKFIAALSRQGETVSCFVEEHTMESTAAGWVGGRQRWTVKHDPEQGVRHLASSGTLPAAFEAIAAGRRAEQDAAGGDSVDVDYVFDTPIDLAERITGFRHDADDGARFEVLRPISTPGGLRATADCKSVPSFSLAEYSLGGTVKGLQGGVAPFLDGLHLTLLEVAVEETEFLIVVGADGSFMQTAASPTEDGRLMLEWQRPEDGTTRHYRLVRRSGPFGRKQDAPIQLVVDEALVHLHSYAEHGVPAAGAFLLDVTDEAFG